MKIVFLLTYPIYHDGWTTEDWLRIENQNRWIPGVLAELGHEIEYWAGGHTAGCYTSQMNGFPDYPIRIFETDARGGRTKFHTSPALVAHARQHPADLYLLKGVDGGLGTALLRHALLPEKRPFAYVTGGKARGTYAAKAVATIYETAYQARQLQHPRWPWQAALPASRLIPMPKSVDTDVFRPMDEPKTYDVLTVCRVDRRNKSFEELGALSEQVRVGVVGGGEDLDALRILYPRIDWIGRRPNAEIPVWMNRTWLFLHNGLRERRPTRDFFPRALAEACACGTPPIGFSDLIQPDVLPDGVGLRVSREEIVPTVQTLLGDPGRLSTLSASARRHAVENLGKRSSRTAMEQLLNLVERAR